jgi:uroporphyrinogen-III synthase
MAKKILITKNLSKQSAIIQWFENNPEFELIHQSQIKIAFKKNELPLTKWVFFSSKNAVEGYFFNNGTKQAKFAAIGNATAATLKVHDCNPSFIGSSNNTEKIAQQFQEVLGNESVLFPVGNLSKRNMAQYIKPEQVEFSLVYDSILEAIAYDCSFDVISFTSPSNVDSFLKENALNEQQQIISIGNTTAKHLKSIHPKLQVLIPDSFSEDSILQKLKDLL